MNFIPLSVPNLGGRESEYVQECIDTAWVSSAGSYVNRFEKEIAEYTGSPYAVACVNGTAALHVALRLAGVKPGEHVLVPTLTFIATTNAVMYLHAEPVFFDADEYYNMDVGKLSQFLADETVQRNGACVYKATGRRIAAVVPVHVWGNAVDMERLIPTCEAYGIPVVEDATESLGTRYTKGRYAGRQPGTIGRMGCLSFNGNKIITCGGGGMILTPDEAVAKKIQYLTTQAKDDPLLFEHNEIGYNYRLTNIQSALGVAQLEQLNGFIATKRTNFLRYQNNFHDQERLHLIDPPHWCASNYWHYALRIEGYDRKGLVALIQKLQENGIQTRPVWELNHRNKPFRKYPAYRIENAPGLIGNTLNIPCSSSLTSEEVDYVSETIIRLIG